MVLNVSSRVLDSLTRPHSLHVYHRQQQPLRQDTHPCQDQPPHCDHVITPSLSSTPIIEIFFSFVFRPSPPLSTTVSARLASDWPETATALSWLLTEITGTFFSSVRTSPAWSEESPRSWGTELGLRKRWEVVHFSQLIIIIITFSSWFRSMVLTDQVPLISIMLRMTFISPIHSQTRQLSHNLLRFGEQQFWRKLFILRTFWLREWSR